MVTELSDVRTQLDGARATLEKRRSALGVLVADGRVDEAAQARAEVEELEGWVRDMELAVPVVEQREAEAREAEEREREARERERHNALRQQRIAAAKKVDRALRSLGRAWAEYASIPEASVRNLNRRREGVKAALFAAVPDVASMLDLRRPPRAHWRAFAETEALTIEVRR